MRALWNEDEASFVGEFVRFEPSWMWPKPVQRPGPPVIVGCGPGPRNFGEIVAWADGWFPVPFLGHTADDVRALWRTAEEAGRDPGELLVTVNGVLPDAAQFEAWRDLGAHRVLVPLSSGPLTEVAPVLDLAAPLVERVRAA